MEIANLPLYEPEAIDLLDNGAVNLYIGPDKHGPIRPNPLAYLIAPYDVTEEIEIDLGKSMLMQIRRVCECTRHGAGTWRESITWRAIRVSSRYRLDAITSDDLDDLRQHYPSSKIAITHAREIDIGLHGTGYALSHENGSFWA